VITHSVSSPVGPVRLARPRELPLLRELELAAGEPFRDIGMAEIAEDEPTSLAELAHFLDAGRAWVVPRAVEPAPGARVAPLADRGAAGAADAALTAVAARPAGIPVDPGHGAPVAYLLAEPVDGDLHIAQVSVHPSAAHRGLGAALIEHAARVAVAEGCSALTLTTYRDVPWNAPYYRRLRFVELAESELGAGLLAIRELERAAGLDQWPRVAMRRRPPTRG
jgi:GNAT superfamily N-acetyltransferase